MEKINIKDARIAAALKNSLPELYDGVFVLFHRKSDNYQLMVKPDKWPSYKAAGEIANGIVVVEGGRILVVAPTETSLYWSSASVNGGGVTTSEKIVALSDWEGKASTSSQILKTECGNENYAPGYCNRYSRVNANGYGLTAGKWWLPSAAEMMLIYSNFDKINYGLSFIDNLNQLNTVEYLTSTEYNTIGVWFLNLTHGGMSATSKAEAKFRVRPVSTLLL